MTEATDEELMQQYVGGRAAAFDTIFARYAPRLGRMLARQISRPADVSDLVQQTFLQLHRARKDFRADARLRPWLYTIALNLKRQYFRRKGRRPETGLGELEPPALGAFGNPERSSVGIELRAALGQLPDGQRQVIELHWFEGLPFKEVAAVVGAGESAVKVRAHRGYGRLRKLLAPTSSSSSSSPSSPSSSPVTDPPGADYSVQETP